MNTTDTDTRTAAEAVAGAVLGHVAAQLEELDWDQVEQIARATRTAAAEFAARLAAEALQARLLQACEDIVATWTDDQHRNAWWTLGPAQEAAR